MRGALLFCLLLPGCDWIDIFMGTGGPPAPPEPVYTGPPRANKPGTRPKECQAAMQLITTCKISLQASRIASVAECTSPSYLGDAELMGFLRCLGDAPTCDQLQKCSGPIAPGQSAPTPVPAPAPAVPEPAPATAPTGSG